MSVDLIACLMVAEVDIPDFEARASPWSPADAISFVRGRPQLFALQATARYSKKRLRRRA
jgi:hypothetical protein